MSKHEWPTAPVITAKWHGYGRNVKPVTAAWMKHKDGQYSSGATTVHRWHGYFSEVIEYFPIDYRKDEVQRLQRALTERNITIAGLWKELEQHGESCCESDPTTFAIPPEPEGPIWDKHGSEWWRQGNMWRKDGALTEYMWSTLINNFGPLTSTPPDKPTWNVGDTISQGDDLRVLPTGAILESEHKTMAGKIVHKIGPCELEVTGIRGSTYPSCIQYPLTIIHLPKEGE